MALNKDAMRKGADAIKESVDRAGQGGSFKPFLPSIFWKEDGDSDFILILNEIEEIPKLLMLAFLPDPDNEGWYTNALARTEPIVGESVDPIEEEWLFAPRETNVMIAVRLEPQYEVVQGRQRPRGFEVATTTFDRKVRDADGEVTDEVEEVTCPAVGVIMQSPNNFGNQLTSADANEWPIHAGAIKVTRVGSGTDTSYGVQCYPEVAVDLTNLVEFIGGVSYLGDQLEEVQVACDELSPEEAGLVIGSVLLDRYIDELGDEERYEHIRAGITEPSAYPKKTRGGGKGKAKKKASQRPARPSQRRAPAEVPPPEPEERPTATNRMQELRERAARIKAEKTAAAA